MDERYMEGDWVMLRDGASPYQIESTTKDKVSLVTACPPYPFFKKSAIKPIPITPEILMQNGFLKNGSFYILQGTTYQVMVRKYIDADYLWDLSMSSLEDGSSLKGKAIRYIHQLQHLMRDFEIEKELTLKNE